MLKNIIVSAIFAITAHTAGAEYIWQSDAYGSCGGDWKYGGCTAASLDVEIGVWPVAWGHQVFVVYTHDGWATYGIKEASWEANVANPYGGLDEQWSVSIPVGWTSMGGTLDSVEYAIWVVTADGSAYWNNNGGANFFWAGGGSDAIEIW